MTERPIVNLPDGWHVIPGDGLAGSPEKRFGRTSKGPSPDRHNFWALIVGGKILNVQSNAWRGSAWHPKQDGMNWNKSEVDIAEQAWSIQLESLFPTKPATKLVNRPDGWHVVPKHAGFDAAKEAVGCSHWVYVEAGTIVALTEVRDAAKPRHGRTQMPIHSETLYLTRVQNKIEVSRAFSETEQALKDYPSGWYKVEQEFDAKMSWYAKLKEGVVVGLCTRFNDPSQDYSGAKGFEATVASSKNVEVAGGSAFLVETELKHNWSVCDAFSNGKVSRLQHYVPGRVDVVETNEEFKARLETAIKNRVAEANSVAIPTTESTEAKPSGLGKTMVATGLLALGMGLLSHAGNRKRQQQQQEKQQQESKVKS